MPQSQLQPEHRRFLWIPIAFIIFSTVVLVDLWLSLEGSEMRTVRATTDRRLTHPAVL